MLSKTPISSATDGPQRQVQYIEKLMNNPESRAEVILEKSKTTPELKKLCRYESKQWIIKQVLYSFPAQVENIKIPESVKKALNVAIGRAL